VLRHFSFATTLVRGGTDLTIAAELLGHAGLETTRLYAPPTAECSSKVVDLIWLLSGPYAVRKPPIAGFARTLAAPHDDPMIRSYFRWQILMSLRRSSVLAADARRFNRIGGALYASQSLVVFCGRGVGSGGVRVWGRGR
jgi:hypothetical protein